MCHFHNELFETLVLVSDIIINFFLISEGQMLLIEKKKKKTELSKYTGCVQRRARKLRSEIYIPNIYFFLSLQCFIHFFPSHKHLFPHTILINFVYTIFFV